MQPELCKPGWSLNGGARWAAQSAGGGGAWPRGSAQKQGPAETRSPGRTPTPLSWTLPVSHSDLFLSLNLSTAYTHLPSQIYRTYEKITTGKELKIAHLLSSSALTWKH